MSRQDRKGTCFVISSRGNGTGEVQRRTDQLVKHVIEPALKECGFQLTRADNVSQAGLINSQVIDHLIEDPLVIADVGYEDPTVFYELAVRHAANKPVIQLTLPGHKTPFEVTGNKTIPVDHRDLDSAARGKEELVAEINTLNGNPDPTNPLAASIDLEALSKSNDLQERTNAQIIARLEDIRAELREVHRALVPVHATIENVLPPVTSRQSRSSESVSKLSTADSETPASSTSTLRKNPEDPIIKRDGKKAKKTVKPKGSKQTPPSNSTDLQDFPEPDNDETSRTSLLHDVEKEPIKSTSKAGSPPNNKTSKAKSKAQDPSSTKKENTGDARETSPEKPFKPGKRNHPERRFEHVGTRQSSR